MSYINDALIRPTFLMTRGPEYYKNGLPFKNVSFNKESVRTMVNVLTAEIPILDRDWCCVPIKWQLERPKSNAGSTTAFVLKGFILQPAAHLRLPDAGIPKHEELYFLVFDLPQFQIRKM